MDRKDLILEGLNDQQKAAVVNYEGPTLIVAGAGSGKTKTLTQRIAYMLSSGIKPDEILALTFTKKAAGEMRSRILDSVGRECYPWKITMGTFHAVFIRFLSEFSDRIGFPEKFSIYDENDSLSLIKQVIKKLGLEDTKYKPHSVRSRISLAKNNLITPNQYQQNRDLIMEDSQMRMPKFLDIYREYCMSTKSNGAMDFDDILLQTNALLRDNEDVREILGKRYRYILVDEYQDTNLAQYKILRFLTTVHQNICVVGDDSQSIYSFRGAKIENILRFRQDYPASRTFLLERNYRSTSNIVQAANSLISHNSKRLPKNLFSEAEDGEKIRVFGCDSDRNEAATVVRDIKRRIMENSASENDFVILYRNNFLSRLLEDELRSRSIQYLIYGGHSFYSRKEILDTIALMKFCLNPNDDISLLRIINIPARGIGDSSLDKIKETALNRKVHLWDVINTTEPEEMGIRGTAVRGLKGFRAMINCLVGDETIKTATDYVDAILDRSRIVSTLRDSGMKEDEERAENIDSLRSAVRDWEKEISENPEYEDIQNLPADRKLQEWLASIALLSDTDTKVTDIPHVTLMTIHASKGLEFKYVYVVGVEEGIFPSQKAETNSELEEERRTFYVALTRAEKAVSLSWSSERFRFGNYEHTTSSRFIDEIDPQFLEGHRKKSSGKRLPWDTDDGSDSDSSTGRKYSGGYPSQYSQTEYARRQQSPYSIRTNPAFKGQSATSQQKSYTHSSSTAGQTPVRRTVSVASESFRGTNKTVVNKSELEIIEESNGIKAGTRVIHHIFGRGTVMLLEKRGTDVRITINFDIEGQKVLIERFAKLKIL